MSDLCDALAREAGGYGLSLDRGYGLMPWVDEKLTDTDRELMFEPLRAALRVTYAPVREDAATALGHLGNACGVQDVIGMDARLRCHGYATHLGIQHKVMSAGNYPASPPRTVRARYDVAR